LVDSPALFCPPARPSGPPLFPYTTLFRSLPLRDEWLPFCAKCSKPRGPEKARGGASRLHPGFYLFTNVPATGRKFPERSPRSSKDRKSTRLNTSHVKISYAVFCLKKKTT